MAKLAAIRNLVANTRLATQHPQEAEDTEELGGIAGGKAAGEGTGGDFRGKRGAC